MTCASEMGLPLYARTTVTAMVAEGGGALYLRPWWESSSWARSVRLPAMSEKEARRTQSGRNARRNMLFIVTGSGEEAAELATLAALAEFEGGVGKRDCLGRFRRVAG